MLPLRLRRYAVPLVVAAIGNGDTHVHGPWKSKSHELTGLQRTFPEKYLSRVISLSPPKKPLDRDSESTSAASTVDTLSSCRQHVEKTLSATCGNTQLGNMWRKFDVATCGMLSTGCQL